MTVHELPKFPTKEGGVGCKFDTINRARLGATRSDHRWSYSSLFPSSHQVGTHTSYSEKGISDAEQHQNIMPRTHHAHFPSQYLFLAS